LAEAAEEGGGAHRASTTREGRRGAERRTPRGLGPNADATATVRGMMGATADRRVVEAPRTDAGAMATAPRIAVSIASGDALARKERRVARATDRSFARLGARREWSPRPRAERPRISPRGTAWIRFRKSRSLQANAWHRTSDQLVTCLCTFVVFFFSSDWKVIFLF
jgi:hypothetical protein